MTAPPPFTTLRRYVAVKKVERCALCATQLAKNHSHLLEMSARRMVCACEPCAILFQHREAAPYKRIGRKVRWVPDFQMNDAEWESLLIPIGLAFFVNRSPDARTLAFYPGPAGCTESLLSLDSWRGIAERNSFLKEMDLDTEALLVNRMGSAREHYLVPVDRCFQLVGLIRLHWRGLSGGEDAWREIRQFFAALQEAGRA
jgi:hypothetical protein